MFVFWDEMWNNTNEEEKENSYRQRGEIHRKRTRPIDTPTDDSKTSR